MRPNGPGDTLSRAELLLLVRGQGHPLSTSRLYEWIDFGLIDRPAAPGRGRGRGRAAASWPSAQVSLLIRLLDLRHRRGIREIATLCNVPVYLWLSGADDVPVRQVRRAMLTWRSRTADLSWEHGSRQADFAAERLAGRRLRDGERNRVALPLAEGAFTGRLDVEYLFDGLADVIGRDRAGPTSREADDLMRRYRSGRLAMADLGDDQYLRARSRVSSVWLAAAGANGPAHGAKVPSRAGTACLVLATELGAEIDPSVEH